MALPPEHSATQPDPAEGPRDGDEATGTLNEGISAETPAEGADDAAPGQPGSPRG